MAGGYNHAPWIHTPPMKRRMHSPYAQEAQPGAQGRLRGSSSRDTDRRRTDTSSTDDDSPTQVVSAKFANRTREKLGLKTRHCLYHYPRCEGGTEPSSKPSHHRTAPARMGARCRRRSRLMTRCDQPAARSHAFTRRHCRATTPNYSACRRNSGTHCLWVPESTRVHRKCHPLWNFKRARTTWPPFRGDACADQPARAGPQRAGGRIFGAGRVYRMRRCPN